MGRASIGDIATVEHFTGYLPEMPEIAGGARVVGQVVALLVGTMFEFSWDFIQDPNRNLTGVALMLMHLV